MKIVSLIASLAVGFATLTNLFADRRHSLPWDGKGEILPWDGLDREKKFWGAVDRRYPELEFGFYFWNGDWAIGALEDFENDQILLVVFNDVAGEGIILRNGEEVILFDHDEARLKIASKLHDQGGSQSDYSNLRERIIGHWIDLEDTDQLLIKGQLNAPNPGSYQISYDPDDQWKMSLNLEKERPGTRERADAYFSSRKPLLGRVTEVLKEKDECLVRVSNWLDILVTSKKADPFENFVPYRVILGEEFVVVDESGSTRKVSLPELRRDLKIHKEATEISGSVAEILITFGSKPTDELFRSCLEVAGDEQIKNVRLIIDEKEEVSDGELEPADEKGEETEVEKGCGGLSHGSLHGRVCAGASRTAKGGVTG